MLFPLRMMHMMCQGAQVAPQLAWKPEAPPL